MDNGNYGHLVHWITEREKCRLGKKAGDTPPWSLDPNIANYRYCNVNREHDKVTIWIDKHIRQVDHPSMWFNIVIGRFLNNPGSLGDLGFIEEWNPGRFRTLLDARKSAGLSVFSGAYMIHAKTRGVPKHHYLVDYVFDPLWDERDTVPGKGASCADWDKWLSRFYGMGDFMKNQIITDMKYSPLLEGAEDWETYIKLGPGTKRGLLAIYGDDTVENLLDLRKRLTEDKRVPNVFRDLNNVANCCCELSKYLKLLTGTGRPKMGYTA